MHTIDTPPETLIPEPDREHQDTEDRGTVAPPTTTVFARRKEWASLLKSRALSQK